MYNHDTFTQPNVRNKRRVANSFPNINILEKKQYVVTTSTKHNYKCVKNICYKANNDYSDDINTIHMNNIIPIVLVRHPKNNETNN